MQSLQFIEAGATPRFGEQEYSGLVRIGLPATRWGLLSGLRGCRSCLMMGGGVEHDLLTVTCIDSGLSRVVPVESLHCVFCIVEVFCLVPDFIVFW